MRIKVAEFVLVLHFRVIKSATLTTDMPETAKSVIGPTKTSIGF